MECFKNSTDVLFIYPDFSGAGYSTDYHYPPMGIGSLSEYLSINGFDSEVIDLTLNPGLSYLDEIRKFKPRFIGVTGYLYKYKNLQTLLNSIKQNFHEIPLILGGPIVSSLSNLPELIEFFSCVDIFVAGEGESAILDLCKHGASNIVLNAANYNGLALGNLVSHRERFDELPFPKYESIEINNYPFIYKHKSMTIMTSRGCPFKCTFCDSFNHMGRNFRQRSVDDILLEIEYWQQNGIKKIQFGDDNLTINRRRTYELFDKIKGKFSNSLSFTFSNIRADTIDSDIANILADSNVKNVAVAVESANQTLLNRIKKSSSLDRINKGIENLLNAGIEVESMFMLNLPYETVDESLKTLHYASNRFPFKKVYFFNCTPYPGTQLFIDICKSGKFLVSPLKYLNISTEYLSKPLYKLGHEDEYINQFSSIMKCAREIEARINKDNDYVDTAKGYL